ncbi:uncharacterized protein HD556DRAFT_1448889 [Suillus plorans]|uniref:Uncharacterized protein n=1 Tax=Suillus plorans TaxID=116603 RepID=A0A9P7AFI5_9AGAM|nr:uncharacterized protein HD556DRAFT_1448889 [Suillus plorans]KAG1787246.1 hypothetical protein HD556DRAFT_1448889 [Suillus plorans]
MSSVTLLILSSVRLEFLSRRPPLVLGSTPIDLTPPPLPLSYLLFPNVRRNSRASDIGLRTSPDALRTSSGNLRTSFDNPRKLGARTRVRGAAHELKPSPSDPTLEHVLNSSPSAIGQFALVHLEQRTLVTINSDDPSFSLQSTWVTICLQEARKVELSTQAGLMATYLDVGGYHTHHRNAQSELIFLRAKMCRAQAEAAVYTLALENSPASTYSDSCHIPHSRPTSDDVPTPHPDLRTSCPCLQTQSSIHPDPCTPASDIRTPDLISTSPDLRIRPICHVRTQTLNQRPSPYGNHLSPDFRTSGSDPRLSSGSDPRLSSVPYPFFDFSMSSSPSSFTIFR